MTRDEVKQLVRMAMAIYPNLKPDNIKETVDAWTFMLSDYPGELVGNAFKTFVRTSRSGFAPSISELIEYINKPVETMFPNEVEAWALVSDAIRRSAYYAEEEFKKLPEPVQKSLGSPTMLRAWSMDEEFNENVAMSNFCRTYRQVIDREKYELKSNPELVLEVKKGGEKLIGRK